jgi:hypothetical protein
MIRPSTLVVLCMLSGSAFSQGNEDTLPPDRPLVPALNPQGRSPNQKPWAQHAYWIWVDAQGWHLRATTAGQTHRFSGAVEAADGMEYVRALDPNMPLQTTARSFQFDVAVSGGEQGVDWRPMGSGCARFNIAIDGFPRPGNTKIGYSEGRPPSREPFDLCPGAAAPPVAEETYQGAQGPEMDPDAFRPVLSPYGQWIWVPGYGQVWQPYASVVGPSFVPYTNGNWTYSDAGWVFVSSYPWGWAPFHYGNWVYADAGWCWVPGRVWAPAWVDWRYGNGYVGWYPIAPVGYTGVVVVRQPVYTYVPEHQFTAANVGTHAVTPVQAAEIHGQTHSVTSAGYVGGHAVVPVNAGPPVAGVSAAVGHPIAAVPVHQVSSTATVLPPPSQAGVHYIGGASAARPVVTAPLPVAHPVAPAGGLHSTPGGGAISPAAGGVRPIAPPPTGGSPAGGAHDIVAPTHGGPTGASHPDHESAMGAAHEADPHGSGKMTPPGSHPVAPATGNPGHTQGGNARPGAPPSGETVGGGGNVRPAAPAPKPAPPPPPKPKAPPPAAKPAHPVNPAPPHKDQK